MKAIYTSITETKDGVKVFLHEKASFPRVPNNGSEVEAYISRGRALEPNKKLVAIDITIDGDEAEIYYKYEPVKFERIRRITGYLVGTLDRFNDAKRAEESERVKHMSAKKELEVGKTYCIDLYAFLLDKLGSYEAIEALKDGEEIGIEFGQKLRVETDPTAPRDPYIDLYSEGDLLVCNDGFVQVEYVGSSKVVCRSASDSITEFEFMLTPEHAAKYLS